MQIACSALIMNINILTLQLEFISCPVSLACISIAWLIEIKVQYQSCMSRQNLCVHTHTKYIIIITKALNALDF